MNHRRRSVLSRKRKIAAFSFRFALAYGLLIAPWPGWVETYGSFYASAAAFLFESTDPDRSVRIRHFVPQPGTSAATAVQDTAVRLEIRGARVGLRGIPPFGTARSSRYTGYLPTALAISLVVATPIPWRRRAWALPSSFFLASGFSALMLAIWIHGWFYGQECFWLANFSQECVSKARIIGSLVAITAWPGPYYIAPVFIWMLVSLRPEDIESVLAKLPPGTGVSAPLPALRHPTARDRQGHRADQKRAEEDHS